MGSEGMTSMCASTCEDCEERFAERRAIAEAASAEVCRNLRREAEFSVMLVNVLPLRIREYNRQLKLATRESNLSVWRGSESAGSSIQ